MMRFRPYLFGISVIATGLSLCIGPKAWAEPVYPGSLERFFENARRAQEAGTGLFRVSARPGRARSGRLGRYRPLRTLGAGASGPFRSQSDQSPAASLGRG